MRVLMVTEDIPAPQVGGLGKHVVTLSNKLIEAGHEVALLGRADVDYRGHAAEVGFAGQFIAGFRMDRNGWKESQLGVWMPYKRRALARRIEEAITAHAAGFDIVHYHGHLPLAGLNLPNGLPFVQTRHDQGSECLRHTRFKQGELCDERHARDCAGCASSRPNALQTAVSAFAVDQFRRDVATNFSRRHTIFVSEFLRRQFQLAVPGADMSRTHVLHNFIDQVRLGSLSASAAAPVEGRVLLAGRIDESKGFARFLKAWHAAPAHESGRLLIVGDGPSRAALELAYAGRADFAGWMPYERTIELTTQAHVCVVPSILQESCGTTILESLVLGRPCVALRRGGTPELARYQRYPGQLRLAETMEGAVALTHAALAEPPVLRPVIDTSEADVMQALPKLLAIYDQVRKFAPASAIAA